jgi:hypothetical protein
MSPPLDRTRLIVIQVMPDLVHADLSLGTRFLGIDGSTSLVGMFWLPERTPPMFLSTPRVTFELLD